MSSDFIHLHQPLDPEFHQPSVLDPDSFHQQPEIFQDIRISPFTPVAGGIVEGFTLNEGVGVAEPIRHFLICLVPPVLPAILRPRAPVREK